MKLRVVPLGGLRLFGFWAGLAPGFESTVTTVTASINVLDEIEPQQAQNRRKTAE
jgi:hypothetical protein